MQFNHLPEKFCVTFFMEGLHNDVARAEVFRVHPSTFEEVVAIALMTSIILRQLAMVQMVINLVLTISLSLCISAMLIAMKQSFKLLSNDNVSVVLMFVEVLGTCGLLSPCTRRSKHDRVVFPPPNSKLVQCGDMSTSIRRGAPC